MTNGTSLTGAGGTVVVIDSGWSSSWNPGRLVWQYDFANRDGDARNPAANTHGALVTARILQDAPEVGVIALKVMPDGTGGADGETIEQALQWVAANAKAYNVVGVNLSLGGGSATAETTTLLSDELASLASQRVLVTAAAGNAGKNGAATDVSWYAADPNVICVTASTGDGGLPGWAQRNPAVTDLCADGTGIVLGDLAGRTVSMDGSSFATPAVTAAAALAQQQAVALRGTALTQQEFLAFARETGTPVGATGYTELNTPALLAGIARAFGPPAPVVETVAPQPPQPPQPPIPQSPTAPVTTGPVTTVTAGIVVNAWGTAAAGINAHFTLLVDGRPVGEATVGNAPRNYAFSPELTADAPHTIQIRYDNDGFAAGQDRNLTLGSVTINGRALAPTDPSAHYDRGPLDGQDIGPGQATLWWDGALVIQAGRDLFAARTAELASVELASAELRAADAVWSHAVTGGAGSGPGTPPAPVPAFDAGPAPLLPWQDGLTAEHLPPYEHAA